MSTYIRYPTQSGSSSGGSTTTPVAVSGTTKTLALTDAGTIQVCSNASAQTITVPPNSSVAFDLGTNINFAQYGAGQVAIAAGIGVTINSKLGNLKLSTQYSGATLVQTSTDIWYLIGDLSA